MTEKHEHETTTPAVDRTDRSINKAGEEVKVYGSLNEPPYAPEPFKADTEASSTEASSPEPAPAQPEPKHAEPKHQNEKSHHETRKK